MAVGVVAPRGCHPPPPPPPALPVSPRRIFLVLAYQSTIVVSSVYPRPCPPPPPDCDSVPDALVPYWVAEGTGRAVTVTVTPSAVADMDRHVGLCKLYKDAASVWGAVKEVRTRETSWVSSGPCPHHAHPLPTPSRPLPIPCPPPAHSSHLLPLFTRPA